MWDEMIIRKSNQKGFASLKLCRFTIGNRKKRCGVAGLALLMRLKPDFFDIEIYKKIKAGSGIGSSAASAAERLWNQCLRTHLKLKIWYSCLHAKLACGNAHADNVALPFGWIYFVRSYSPLDKIESPSELYATVVHPQIELKHQMRVPY
jgi:homoserine kinase